VGTTAVIGQAFSDAAVREGGGHDADLQASYVGVEALLGFSCVMRNPRATTVGMAVVTIFSVGGGRPDWVGCGDLLISHLVLAASWGCAPAGKNSARTLVVAGDGDITRRNLLEGMIVAVCVYSLVLLRRKP
jgi:hypothetical protein